MDGGALEIVVSCFELGNEFCRIDGGFVVPGGDANRGAGGLCPADEGVSRVRLDDAEGTAGFEDAVEFCEDGVPLLIEMVQYVDAGYSVEGVVFERQRMNRIAYGGMESACIGEFDAVRGDVESDDGRSVECLPDDAVAAADIEQTAFVWDERVELVQGFLWIVVEDVRGGELVEEISLVRVCGCGLYRGNSLVRCFQTIA